MPNYIISWQCFESIYQTNISSFRNSISSSKLKTLRLDLSGLIWILSTWHPPENWASKTRVISRHLEPRFLCSENYMLYPRAIHLDIEPWRLGFLKEKSSLRDSICKLWWILIHVVRAASLLSLVLIIVGLSVTSRKTQQHFCTFFLSHSHTKLTPIYTSSCQVRFL